MKALYQYLYYIRKGWSTERLNKALVRKQLEVKVTELYIDMNETKALLEEANNWIREEDEEDHIHGCTFEQRTKDMEETLNKYEYFKGLEV